MLLNIIPVTYGCINDISPVNNPAARTIRNSHLSPIKANRIISFIAIFLEAN